MTTQQNAAEAAIITKATEELIDTVGNQGAVPAKADTPAPEPAPAIAESDDDREFREANEAALAEEKAKAAPVAPDKAAVAATGANPDANALPPAAPKTDAPAVEPKPGDKSARTQIMVPKARLDDALQKLEEARAIGNYNKGVADTRIQMTQTTTQTEPVKKPQELLDEIDAGRISLAEKYDNGELTYTEMRKQDLVLQKQSDAIRDGLNKIDGDRIRLEAVRSAKTEAMNDRLNEQAVTLEQQHPSLLMIKSDHQWDFLNQEASRMLLAEGVQLVEGDSASIAALRQRIAELADQYAPIWNGSPAPAPANGGTSQRPQQTNTPIQPAKTISRPTAQQRGAKLELANQQPPLSQGNTNGGPIEYTDQQIVGMTDDELAGLPDAVRNRFLGKGKAA